VVPTGVSDDRVEDRLFDGQHDCEPTDSDRYQGP